MTAQKQSSGAAGDLKYSTVRQALGSEVGSLEIRSEAWQAVSGCVFFSGQDDGVALAPDPVLMLAHIIPCQLTNTEGTEHSCLTTMDASGEAGGCVCMSKVS